MVMTSAHHQWIPRLSFASPLAIRFLPYHRISTSILTTLTTRSQLIEKCAFPPTLGGTGTCSLEELGQIRGVINDMCNFLNATLYTAQAKCLRLYSSKKTFQLIGQQDTVVT